MAGSSSARTGVARTAALTRITSAARRLLIRYLREISHHYRGVERPARLLWSGRRRGGIGLGLDGAPVALNAILRGGRGAGVFELRWREIELQLLLARRKQQREDDAQHEHAADNGQGDANRNP